MRLGAGTVEGPILDMASLLVPVRKGRGMAVAMTSWLLLRGRVRVMVMVVVVMMMVGRVVMRFVGLRLGRWLVGISLPPLLLRCRVSAVFGGQRWEIGVHAGRL